MTKAQIHIFLSESEPRVSWCSLINVNVNILQNMCFFVTKSLMEINKCMLGIKLKIVFQHYGLPILMHINRHITEEHTAWNYVKGIKTTVTTGKKTLHCHQQATNDLCMLWAVEIQSKEAYENENHRNQELNTEKYEPSVIWKEWPGTLCTKHFK